MVDQKQSLQVIFIGSITPYVMMRKKIFSAAKSKVPGDKSTGLFARTKMFSNFSDKLTDKITRKI